MGLTNLLFYLQEVILLDSVALRQLYPSHPVWNHPVFQHSAYAAFAQKVEACLQDKEHPSQLSLLHQAMPLLRLPKGHGRTDRQHEGINRLDGSVPKPTVPTALAPYLRQPYISAGGSPAAAATTTTTATATATATATTPAFYCIIWHVHFCPS
jgi:Centromere DNA-binding protein complex CBF3 subunit, domain 2